MNTGHEELKIVRVSKERRRQIAPVPTAMGINVMTEEVVRHFFQFDSGELANCMLRQKQALWE